MASQSSIAPRDDPLSLVYLGPRRDRSAKPLGSRAKGVLRAVTPAEPLDATDLVDIPVRRRLNLVRAVCSHFQEAVRGLPRPPQNPQRPTDSVMPGAEHHLGSAIHLTPPELAQEITDYVSSIVSPEELPIHFGDPAIGTGAFYLALLKAFPKDAIASAIGIDVSYEQVRAARSRLAKYPIQIVHGDFLHMDQLPQRNLILANPPYLRHQGIRKKYKEELRQRTSTKLGIRVSGRSGLYLYFMILSHEWMAPNAIGVWLIPSEFMQTSYACHQILFDAPR